MTQDPITVTYSLDEILKQINGKLEKLPEIEVNLAKIETKLDNVTEKVTKLEKSATVQIWALIGILFAAVSGFLIAVGRFVISGNP